MAVISAKDLTVEYYNSGFSLKHISFSIDEGEIVLLTGPSGSGKTMLLYCLSGVIPHCLNMRTYTGAVYINGVEISKTALSEITKMLGIVLQNPTAQIFGRTVEEDMAFGLENLCVGRDEIKRRIDETLKLVDLEKYRESDPFSLSGGERQRVAIGSTLVMKPDILLLDEPTSNLDSRGTKGVIQTIERLKEEKKTVVLVERNIEHIMPVVDRIIALYDGEKVTDSKPRDFFAKQILVEKLGVNPPQVVRLIYRLRAEGIDIKELPISIQELYCAIDDKREWMDAKYYQHKKSMVQI